MGIDVQKAGKAVPYCRREKLRVYAVRQSRGYKGMLQVVKLDFQVSRPLQGPVQQV